jgi:hypothetical protein
MSAPRSVLKNACRYFYHANKYAAERILIKRIKMRYRYKNGSTPTLYYRGPHGAYLKTDGIDSETPNNMWMNYQPPEPKSYVFARS